MHSTLAMTAMHNLTKQCWGFRKQASAAAAFDFSWLHASPPPDNLFSTTCPAEKSWKAADMEGNLWTRPQRRSKSHVRASSPLRAGTLPEVSARRVPYLVPRLRRSAAPLQELSAQQLLLHLQDHGHHSLQQAAHTLPPLEAGCVHLHHDVSVTTQLNLLPAA
jgi:hypothetical protein